MALNCGSRLAKCILFVFNVVFWLAGACLLGVGIWVLVDEDAGDYMDIASSDADLEGAAIFLIVIGAIIFVTGGLGCLGAITENTCMLTSYAVILIILLVLQVVAGILAVVYRDEILDDMEESMNTTVQHEYGQDKSQTEQWNRMQHELECCGSAGPDDWASSQWHADNPSKVVPDTCCVLKNDDWEHPKPKNITLCYAAVNDQTMANREEYLHVDGCHEALEDWIEDHAAILIGVAFGLLAIQVIGIILACCLRKNISGEYKYV